MAFSAAQLAAEEYPSYAVRIPVYLLATGVGVSRLATDQHWVGDVEASAILGILLGHTLARVHKRPASDWKLLVQVDGFKVAWSF
jgi:membrane-associated phospholipid phosphatase